MKEHYWVVIPAGGKGARYSQEIPKQYLRINHQTILEHTIEIFLTMPCLARIVVAIPEHDVIFSHLPLSKNPKIEKVAGGITRGHSVLNALEYIAKHASPADWVLVHDAVRPCLHRDDLQHLLKVLSQDEIGGILAAPCIDTMKWVDEDRITHSVSRSNLWRALTPQMFKFELLFSLLKQQGNRDFTDEASLLEQHGYAPKIVKAQHPNPKLTYQEDLDYIAFLIQEAQMVEA